MRKLCDGVVCPGTGRRLHQRFGPPCTAAWAEQDGPVASHRSFRCVVGDWFRQSIRQPILLTRRRVVRRGRGWTAGSSDPHSRRARPLRGCPRPDGAAYKSRIEPFGRASYGQPGPTSRVFRGQSVSGQPRRAQQGRVTPGTGHLRPSRPTVGSSPGCLPLSRRCRRWRGQKKRKRGTRCSVRHRAGVHAAQIDVGAAGGRPSICCTMLRDRVS